MLLPKEQVALARDFFHRIDGGFQPDTNGTECPDLHTARLEAIQYAAGTLRDHPEYVWSGREMRIAVSNESERLLFTVVILAFDSDVRW